MRKKIKIILLAFMLLFLLAAVIFIFSTDINLMIKKEFNESFLEKKQISTLSADKMEKEYDHFVDILSTSCPEVINGNDLTGINFNDKNELYRSRIKQASSNMEYFYVLKAITSDIKSCHTDILYSDIMQYSSNINGYASSVNSAVYQYSDYWKEELFNCVNDYTGETIGFAYCNGKYISCNIEGGNIYYLKEVSGVPVDTYVKDTISLWKINYDFKFQKAFRNSIVFDKEEGQQQVQLTLEDELGQKSEQTAFINWKSEIYTGYSFLLNTNSSNEPYDADFYYDTERSVCFIRLNSMSGDTDKFSADIEKIPNDIENIVLDLRGNSGGYPMFAKENVYSKLFSKSAYIETQSTVFKSKYNNFFDKKFDELNSDVLSVISDSDDKKIYSITDNYIGNSSNSRNVYILTSHNTASAADELTAAAKSCGTAVVIGENTGGEGIGLNSSVIIPLKTSGLCLRYNSAESKNPDGSINSIYGTSPDYYSTLTENNYMLWQKIENSEKDPSEYENRLKWDNVLTETLELIKEKGNAE